MPKRPNWFLRKTPESNWLLCLLWLNVIANLLSFVTS